MEEIRSVVDLDRGRVNHDCYTTCEGRHLELNGSKFESVLDWLIPACFWSFLAGNFNFPGCEQVCF